jgi:hypothetical protein
MNENDLLHTLPLEDDPESQQWISPTRAPRALVEAVWLVLEKIERRLSPACSVNAGH